MKIFPKKSAFCIILLALSLLTACGAESSGGGGGGQTLSYKDMKSMVIDILKTEDAQKALQESAPTEGGLQAQMLSVQGQEQIRIAVKDTLASPEYDKVISKLMTDTRFAGEFAKAVDKENKQIHKDLMKDPGYQKDMLTILKDPEMEKLVLEVMQSPQFRKHIQTVMQETMQSPIVRLEMLELLKKAVQEELKPKPTEKPDTGGGGGGEEGGSSGGGEGGDGG